MAGMAQVGFSWHHLLTDWQLSPFALFVLAVCLATAVWYLNASWKLAARGRRWSGGRTLSFLGGLLAIDLALQSSVATFTASYFQAHVVQHLLLMVIGPPLLALGAPMTLALQTSSHGTKVRLLGILNSRPFKAITHPIVVWGLYYGTMFAFFLTFFLGYAMEHMWVMDLVNLGFFFASTLFWWPIVSLDPIPHWKMSHGTRMGNLLIGVPVEAFLGLALVSTTHSAAPMYSLSSTHSGGAILWVGAEVFTFIAIIPIFLQWVRADERQARRNDARLDAAAAAGGAVPVPTLAEERSTEPVGAGPVGAEPGRRRSAWLPQTRPEDAFG